MLDPTGRPAVPRASRGDRKHSPGSLFLFDPRPYRQHRGQFLYADRVFLGSVWTPIVRVRPRRPRASDGGTEI